MADEKPADDVKLVEPDFSSLDEEQESPKESSPKAEIKKEAKAEKEIPKEPVAEPETKVEESKDEAKAEPEKKETEDKPEEVVEETKPLGRAEERKAQLNTEIRELVSKRNSLKEVEALTSEIYQPAVEADLTGQVNSETGENYTRVEAKLEAMRQAGELRDYNNSVADARQTIGMDAYRVMQDFPVFNPDSKDYDKELADDAAELMDANFIRDNNVPEIDPKTGQPTGKGLVIGSNVMPYQLYKTLARASGISATKGQIKGQEATEQMLANADAGGSSSPPAKEKDPLMESLKNWDED